MLRTVIQTYLTPYHLSYRSNNLTKQYKLKATYLRVAPNILAPEQGPTKLLQEVAELR